MAIERRNSTEIRNHHRKTNPLEEIKSRIYLLTSIGRRLIIIQTQLTIPNFLEKIFTRIEREFLGVARTKKYILATVDAISFSKLHIDFLS